MYDMDKNDSLSSAKKIVNGPSESMLAAFILVYGNCHQPISTTIPFCATTLWKPHFFFFFFSLSLTEKELIFFLGQRKS